MPLPSLVLQTCRSSPHVLTLSQSLSSAQISKIVTLVVQQKLGFSGATSNSGFFALSANAATSTHSFRLKVVGPKAYHSSFADDQLMKLYLLMILCQISDRFMIKILVGA